MVKKEKISRATLNRSKQRKVYITAKCNPVFPLLWEKKISGKKIFTVSHFTHWYSTWNHAFPGLYTAIAHRHTHLSTYIHHHHRRSSHSSTIFSRTYSPFNTAGITFCAFICGHCESHEGTTNREMNSYISHLNNPKTNNIWLDVNSYSLESRELCHYSCYTITFPVTHIPVWYTDTNTLKWTPYLFVAHLPSPLITSRSLAPTTHGIQFLPRHDASSVELMGCECW